MLFLILTVPMSLVWQQVSPSVDFRQFGVRIQEVQGRLWQGQALASVHNQPVLLNWSMRLSGLVQGHLPINFELESSAGDMLADLNLGLTEIELVVPRMELALKGLNPALRQQRLELDGELQAQGLRVVLRDGRPEFAEGRLAWSGGDIAYPAGRAKHERTMPAFQGSLTTTEQGEIKLDIRDLSAQFSVIEALLTDDGVGLVQVRRRLLDLANEPWAVNSDEQDVVFKIKKPLFSAGSQHG
ncbi:MAG: type II secretion system protein N [Oleiphilaceae bacterium]|nr:type II secretion system protein N [Oleiphilaceae bacterium]